MASLNQVFLMGNLTNDPEVKYLPSGSAVADMYMAVNRRYKTRDGQDAEETCFVAVEVWGRQAETCGQYLRKGSGLLVTGRLKYDAWEKDGQKFNRLKVRAMNVQFLSSGGGSRNNSDGSQQPQQQQQPYGGQSEQSEGNTPRQTTNSAPPPPKYDNNTDFVNDTGDDDSLPF